MNKSFQNMLQALAISAALAGGMSAQPAAAAEKVIVVREVAGLHDAALELRTASRRLLDDVQALDNRRYIRASHAYDDIARLVDHAATFEVAASRRSFAALHDEYLDLSSAYAEAQDRFDRLPGGRAVDYDVDRVRAAMRRVRQEYSDRTRRPVPPPPPVVVDRGDVGSRLDLARQIQNATDDLRDRAKDVAHNGDARGSHGDIDNKLELLDHLAKRGNDLRDVVNNRQWDLVRVNYDKLREVLALAAPQGRFGRDVEVRYTRVRDLTDRFGDTFGRRTERVIIEKR